MGDRSTCPHCGKLLAVVDSRSDGDLRVQRFGCRPCNYYGGGAVVLSAALPRTRIMRTLVDSVRK